MFELIFFRIKRVILKILMSPIELAKKDGVSFGDNCIVNGGVNFGTEPYLITIGDNFYSSSNVQFITHDGSVNVLRNLYGDLKNVDLILPIVLGNNVFLGYGVSVLPGSVIEDNVIVGAHSLVKGRLKSNSVYAGIPAKYICSVDDFLTKNKSMFIFTKHMSSLKKKEFLVKHFDINLKAS